MVIFKELYKAHLSSGETHFFPSGVKMIPENLWCKLRVFAKFIRTNFLPEHFLGSHCSISHKAKGNGILFSVEFGEH